MRYPVYDTLFNHDTTICLGSFVRASVDGPSTIGYEWTPTTGVSNPHIKNPIITPPDSNSVRYTVTASSNAGCPSVSNSFTINTLAPPTLQVEDTLLKTCTGIPVQMNVYAYGAGGVYQYQWAPGIFLNSDTISNPVVNPEAPIDILYRVIVNPRVLPGCTSTETVHVHAIPDMIQVLNADDTSVCISNNAIQVRLDGSDEFMYTWIPATGVSYDTAKQPIITTPVSAEYVVAANYAHCPTLYDSLHITIDTFAPRVTIIDTICLGMSDSFNLTVAGDTAYHYHWSPATGVSNVNIANPIITPTNFGLNDYTVSIAPTNVECLIRDDVRIYLLPNSVNIFTGDFTPSIFPAGDTGICKGNTVQIIDSGSAIFHYQWLPTAGIATPNLINPLITPDTSATYVLNAYFHRCPLIKDSVHIDVEPNPQVYIGGNRFLCEFDTLRVNAYVTPNYYTNYTYSWTPATGLDNTNTLP